MTKKRLYVLFAFLFVAVFALVCAFTLTACGKDEEEDKTPDGTEEVLPGDEGGEEPGDEGGEEPGDTGDDDDDNPGEHGGDTGDDDDDNPGGDTGDQGDDPDEPEEEHTYSVQITTTTIEYTVGATESFDAKVFCDSEEIADATVTWTSSDANIATIESSTGLFTAVAEGTTVITATYTYGNGQTVTDALTVKVSAKEEPGTSEAEQTFPVELDFNGDRFTAGQVFVEKYTTEGEGEDAVNIAPGDGKVTYSDGTETGFTAMGSADDSKIIEIKTQGSYTALHFDGSAELTKNSIAYTLEAAGTYYIKMSYFAPSSSSDVSGRYGVVYIEGASGSKEEVGPVADSEKTGNDTDIKTRTVEITITDATTIYIGSKSSGLYFTFIGIYDEDPNGSSSKEHTHTYGDPVWAWEQEAGGAWTCGTVTITCAGCEDTADGHTITADATVTSQTSGEACTQQTIVYTAKATLNGQEIEDTKAETIAASANHQYEAEFTWTPTEEGFSVSVTFTCSVCGTSYTDASSAQVSGPAADGIYTATIADSYGNEYTDNYDPNDGIYFVSIEDYAHMTAKVGDTFTLAATIKDGHGSVVTPADGSVTWSTDTSNLITLSAESGDITCDATGTAIVYAIYTDSEGKTWTSDPYYILISAAKTTPEGDQYDVKIDFSNAEGLEIGSSQMVALDENSTLTYVDIDLEGKVENGVLETNSFTKYGNTTYTNYILVDFSQFSGYSFEIKITFASDSSSWGQGQTATKVAVVDALVENAGGYGASSSIFGESAPDLSNVNGQTWTEGDGYVTYTYPLSGSGSVAAYNQTLYIVWDATVKISSISLTLWKGDKPFKLDTDWEGLEIDFADPPSEFTGVYKNNQYVASTVVMGDGVLTLTDLDANITWSSSWNYTDTGAGTHTTASTGNTQGATELTDYFTVNLNGLQGESVVITIVFSTASGSEGTLYLLYDAGELSGETVGTTNVIGSATGSMDKKLSVAFTVPDSGLVYIEYSEALQIKSIGITLGETEDTDPVYSLEIDTQNAQTSLIVDDDERGSTTLTAMVYIDGTYNAEASTTVTWTSSDPSVATVSGGVVTALKAGDTYITISYNGLESGKILIRVNIVMPEGTVAVDFTDATAGWGDIITASATSRDTYTLVDSMLTYKAGATQYDHFVGWTADGDGVYALETGDGAAYGSSGWNTAGSGSKDNLINYFTVDTSGSNEMTIRVIYSAVSDALDELVEENESYSYPDTQTGFVALTKGFPSITTGTWWSASGSDEYEEKVSYVTSYLLDSDAIKSTNGVGYNNSVVLTWTGSVEDLDEVYIILGSSMYIYSIEIYLDGYAPGTGEGDGDGEDVGGGMVEITETVNFNEEPYNSYTLTSDGKIADLTDILTLYMRQNSSYKTEYVTANNRTALSMSIYSNYDTGNTSPTAATCITIDVSELHGQTITIELEWSADSSGRQTYLALGTSMQRNNTSKGSDGILEIVGGSANTITTTTWNVAVPDDTDTLFLYVTGGMFVCYLYSISVTYMAEGSGAANEHSDDPTAGKTATQLVYVDFSDNTTVNSDLTGMYEGETGKTCVVDNGYNGTTYVKYDDRNFCSDGPVTVDGGGALERTPHNMKQTAARMSGRD